MAAEAGFGHRRAVREILPQDLELGMVRRGLGGDFAQGPLLGPLLPGFLPAGAGSEGQAEEKGGQEKEKDAKGRHAARYHARGLWWQVAGEFNRTFPAGFAFPVERRI